MATLATEFDAGCVRIRVGCRRGRINAVSVAIERPDVTRVLCGKPADAAVSLVPLIFAVCGRAQGRAAALALAAARGVETPPRLDPLIESEVLREHLWRLLLDLPPLLGMEARRELFATAVRAVNTGARDDLAGVMADPFWNDMMAALARGEAPEMPAGNRDALLPVMSARQSLAHWSRLDDQMCRMPLWQGQPAETGAYARWNGQNPAEASPFAARWHARCAEVWSWAGGGAKVGAGGTASAAAVAPGIGRALVETARGLLVHEITLDGDSVADYRIVAPTEWNFHPAGVLPEWLLGQVSDDLRALERYAAQAVSALDPCVRWEFSLE